MPQGSAAAIFNPVVQSLSPVAISFVPENGTAPDLPSNVHLLQEYVIPPNVNQNRFFLFTHEIGDVATLGEIVDPDGSGQSSNLKVDTYFNYSIASRVVYVTGQIGTQNISVNFQLPFRSDITMVFVPVKKLDNPPSQPVWIDWKHLTINVTGSASILEAIPGVLACALLIFFIVKAFTF
ncbi:unnamed protein product [Dibothriocephalus latus]|uniref:Uncharacterized protein n=1 Tax=Dibothriocephalus latus TaxID=60516 RepID=A0A3P6SIR8_DIBLA|nr:unnamed protein product [Dibothriocephalus latus]